MKPTVADAMPSTLAFVRDTDTVSEALERMAQHKAETVFPVLSEGDRWAGLVLRSQLETMEAERQSDESLTAGKLARPGGKVRTLALSPHDSLDEALDRMARGKVSGLPVLKDEAVVGVLSRAQARSYLGAAWAPATFTAGLRGQPQGGPPIERWENLLHAERSCSYRLARLVSRFPAAGRRLGLHSTSMEAAATRLQEREQAVQSLRSTWLGRFLPSPGPVQKRRDAASSGEPAATDRERPRVGHLLSSEIDAALELLSSIPFEELQERGWHVQPNHFYWPLNDLDFLRANPALWARARLPAEIDWDLDGQVQLARRLLRHAGELSDVRDDLLGSRGEFVWDNRTFPRSDASIYYGLLRDLRPRRVIEVGAGWSSLVLERAVQANGTDCEITLVEPQPNLNLLQRSTERWRIVRQLVQHVEPALFETLEAGDVLFYDGSHCVRTASDVNWILFEVLPRLAPGVWVHFHDVHWPGDYPSQLILDEGLSWNEQYMLQAFLMHNDAYRVRLVMKMLLVLRKAEIEPLFPVPVTGGSVWLEKTGQANAVTVVA